MSHFVDPEYEPKWVVECAICDEPCEAGTYTHCTKCGNIICPECICADAENPRWYICEECPGACIPWSPDP